MNKPLCKITLQDLLDSIQPGEGEQRRPAPHPRPKNESLNDWLSLDEIAEDLNINPDLLYAYMSQVEMPEKQNGVSVYSNYLQIKH